MSAKAAAIERSAAGERPAAGGAPPGLFESSGPRPPANEKRPRPVRDKKPWTDSEVGLALERWIAGEPPAEIGRRLGRKASGVMDKIRRIVEDRQPCPEHLEALRLKAIERITARPPGDGRRRDGAIQAPGPGTGRPPRRERQSRERDRRAGQGAGYARPFDPAPLRPAGGSRGDTRRSAPAGLRRGRAKQSRRGHPCQRTGHTAGPAAGRPLPARLDASRMGFFREGGRRDAVPPLRRPSH